MTDVLQFSIALGLAIALVILLGWLAIRALFTRREE